MKVCILQPSYVPWKGYFHQILKSDYFVFLDTVQYDKRGWRNRNKIKTAQGLEWLTIPVHAKGSHQGLKIQEVAIQGRDWVARHLQKMKLAYRQAPHFATEYPWVEETLLTLADTTEQISVFTSRLTESLARHVGITETRFLYASDLMIETSNPSERLLHIVKALEGKTYLSGPSAQQYLDTEAFEAADIHLEWMTYNYPEYPQLYPPFVHEVSILDLLFMVGHQALLPHLEPVQSPQMVFI